MPTAKRRKPAGRPRKGRPFARDPAVTYADKTYIATTFRLSKVAVAQADALADFMQLGSRTAAVQYALGEVFRRVRDEQTSTGASVAKLMASKLKLLGGEE